MESRGRVRRSHLPMFSGKKRGLRCTWDSAAQTANSLLIRRCLASGPPPFARSVCSDPRCGISAVRKARVPREAPHKGTETQNHIYSTNNVTTDSKSNSGWRQVVIRIANNTERYRGLLFKKCHMMAVSEHLCVQPCDYPNLLTQMTLGELRA